MINKRICRVKREIFSGENLLEYVSIPGMQTLPDFPQQVELNFSHHAIIHKVLSEKGIHSSDFAFYNLMGWYLTRPPWISRLNDFILLIVEGPQGGCLLMPPIGFGPIKPVLTRIIDFLPTVGCPKSFHYVPKIVLDEILSAFPSVRYEPRPGDFDYIHLRQDLAELSGRKFHKKKNFVNRISQEYSPKIEIISPATVNEANDFLVNWYSGAENDDVNLKLEKLSAHRMIPHLPDVGGIGILIKIDGIPMGLSIASPVVENCWVVSIEKADKRIKGLYQYVNWAMANQLPETVTFLNRETDLGLEGLRTAKTSYHPQYLYEKFSVFFE